jgi:hypothetical protein
MLVIKKEKREETEQQFMKHINIELARKKGIVFFDKLI